MTRTWWRPVTGARMLLMISAAVWLLLGSEPARAVGSRRMYQHGKPGLPSRWGRRLSLPALPGGPAPPGAKEPGPTGPTGYPGAVDCGQTGACELGMFQSVGCGSSTSCTAVGSAGYHMLAEDRNANGWRFDSPAQGAGGLDGVWCVSPQWCMAVGYGNGGMLADMRNGSSWTMRTIPIPAGVTSAGVSQVSCSDTNACTAVGFERDVAGREMPLAERWNGAEWKPQSPRAPPGATAAWFNNVWCSGPASCAAVGVYYDSAGHDLPLAERWNGVGWVIHAPPLPNGTQDARFYGVSCRPSTTCTAVGGYTDKSGNSYTLAERWNGAKWSIQQSPNPSGATDSWLNAVSCPTSAACTAVGFSQAGSLAEHWNGSHWGIQTTTPPGDEANHSAVLSDLACTAVNFCMAAGTYYDTLGCQLTLAERWNGSIWTVEPSLTQMAIIDWGLPGGSLGQSYSGTLSGCGGPSPFAWSHTRALPTGLSLKPGSGVIAGTPTIAGTSDFGVTVASARDPSNSASSSGSITINPSQPATNWTVQSNGTPMNSPHIGFVLVGDWWCAVTGLNSSQMCTFKNGYPYSCPGYPSCRSEGLQFERAESSLVSTDYGAYSPYWEQLQLWYCSATLDCGGQSLVRRLYNGQAFHGPITTGEASTPGPTLNSGASAWGIQSQDDASNTVFVFLYAPNLTACGSTGSGNSEVQGGTNQYGFVFANVYLEDYANNCNGPTESVHGDDLNLQSPDPIRPTDFATFATSHEVDEAITSPGQHGWVVPSDGGQLADPCTDRTLNGNSVGYDPSLNSGNWPYYNFTRDGYGTVVAAFVEFSYSAENCYPDVSTSVPPG